MSKGLPGLLLGLMVGIPAALPAAGPRDAWVVGATKSAAEKVAGYDEDVVAANDLLDRALAGKPGLSDTAKAKRDAFLKVHYHVGRIEIRRDAAKRAGKVQEKEERLRQAVRKWAASHDTHSMIGPKPTMERLLLLEPPEEAFARNLCHAYGQQLKRIHRKLQAVPLMILRDARKEESARAGPRYSEEDLADKSTEQLIEILNAVRGKRPPADTQPIRLRIETLMRKRGCTPLKCYGLLCRSRLYKGKQGIKAVFKVRNRAGRDHILCDHTFLTKGQRRPGSRESRRGPETMRQSLITEDPERTGRTLRGRFTARPATTRVKRRGRVVA